MQQVFVRAAVAAALVLAAAASPALAAPPAPVAASPAPAEPAGGPPRGTVGAPGVGDPFFPLGGNGGLDVQDYDLALSWDQPTNRLSGTATLRIVATQDLSRFDLDLRGFTLGPITVDGAPAGVARKGQELILTPKRLLRKGSTFTVVVPYSGVPVPVTDPDESIEGWVPTDDGVVVVNEPQGSPGWYPANDTPRDKATYTIAMTVPKGKTAVGNGALVSEKPAPGGRTTFTWREGYPMAPYLTTITIGTFTVTRSTVGRIPIYIAVDPRERAAAAPALRQLPRMVEFLQQTYGRYPFETVGAIVDRAPDLGYALETQTKPVFDTAPDETTLLHELSHQWYGDAVTLRVWPDIWLHEGFATWSEWYWAEKNGGPTAQEKFDELAATPASDEDFWNPPPGKPGVAANLFDGTIYDRGAMTLQALRTQIGDRAFFTVLRRWYDEHRYGNVSTREFVALAEQVSGQDLREFFRIWLYTPGRPSLLPPEPAASSVAAVAATAEPARR